MIRTVTSFDGTEVHQANFLRPDRYRLLFSAVKDGAPFIARGAGLSYCAASAGQGSTSVSTELFNRVLAFDAERGLVTVEAGITLGELYRFCVPNGWIPPVMPGHPCISVGGSIAVNAHGKNQCREGNFASSLDSLTLFHPDKGEILCSRENEEVLFALTVGGFGLTGIILSATLKLQRIPSESFLADRREVSDFEEALSVMRAAGSEVHSLYSWHDLNSGPFGRGFVYSASPVAGRAETALDYDVLDPETRAGPFPAFNRLTTPLAMAAYGLLERSGRRKKTLGLAEAIFPIIGKEFYFRLFGRRGFREYQFLVPESAWPDVSRELKSIIRRRGVPITLASLKLFRGTQQYLNFDGDGICLALDAPESAATHGLFSDLDSLVAEAKGIVNLAKDGRVNAQTAANLFPEYEKFKEDLAAFDPKRRFDSAFRRRLGL